MDAPRGTSGRQSCQSYRDVQPLKLPRPIRHMNQVPAEPAAARSAPQKCWMAGRRTALKWVADTAVAWKPPRSLAIDGRD